MTINLVKPKYIVTLGNTALHALNHITPHNITLKTNVADIFDWQDKKLISLYHTGPRAMIHRPLEKQKNDFMKIVGYLGNDKSITGIATNNELKPILTLDNNLTLLQNVIIYILQQIKELSYFKLGKLLYLIDIKSLELYGNSITEQIYLRQQDGPWIPELLKHLRQIDRKHIYMYFRNRQPYVKIKDSNIKTLDLGNGKINIINEILKKYGTYTDAQIKTRVYLTKPMKYILSKEKYGVKYLNRPVIYKDKTIVGIDSTDVDV